jgi:hypothetical protein
MDSARLVIKHNLNPRFLSHMASYELAITIRRSLMMDSARHVIKRILNPRILSHVASYDVASTSHQSNSTYVQLESSDLESRSIL